MPVRRQAVRAFVARHAPRWAQWVLLAITAAYFLSRVRYGWVPNDAGLAAQCAERVLQGEIPHRDFDEYYTGALSFLDAAAMAIFGVKLLSMSWPLFGVALLFVVSVYRLALRVVPPTGAFLIAITAAVWSVPNYFFPLPTWYNAFFAAFGLQALFRYFDTDRKRWLVWSGVLSGVSLLFKVVGLYVVAAALLTLLYREQARTHGAPSSAAVRRARLLFGGGLCVLPLLVLLVVARRLDAMTALLFVVPPLALSALLGARLWESAPRLGGFAVEATAYFAGVLVPVLAYLTPYVATWGVEELFHNVFAMLKEPLGYHYFGAWLPRPVDFVNALPWAVLFLVGLRARPLPGHRWLAVLAIPLLGWILAEGARGDVYRHFWASVRPLVPIVVVTGCVLLARPRGDDERDQRLFALIAHAGMFSLVQFPYSAAVYFCFTSGLLLLAGLYLVRRQGAAPLPAHGALLAFYTAFALIWLNHGATYSLGWYHATTSDFLPLDEERAGILVSPGDAKLYGAVVAAVREHSGPNDPVYAAPDIPEVQFLSARRNPTRTFFDVFDPDYRDRDARAARVLRTLEEQNVPVVVLFAHGDHSGPPNPVLVAGIERHYPLAETIGPFVVRWRP